MRQDRKVDDIPPAEFCAGRWHQGFALAGDGHDQDFAWNHDLADRPSGQPQGELGCHQRHFTPAKRDHRVQVGVRQKLVDAFHPPGGHRNRH